MNSGSKSFLKRENNGLVNKLSLCSFELRLIEIMFFYQISEYIILHRLKYIESPKIDLFHIPSRKETCQIYIYVFTFYKAVSFENVIRALLVIM